MASKLLITGFEPFGGGDTNPSWLAVEALPEITGGFHLRKLRLPTVFAGAAGMVVQAAEEYQPDLILCIGQAGGRDAVTPERIAVNIRDARIPDNRGQQPQGEAVVPEGPAAYFATVPVKEMALAIRSAGIPGAVSNTAGTYVCNDVLYTLLHRFHGTDVRVGFIHVPWLPQQGSPSLPLEKTVEALAAAIAACKI